MTTLYTRLTGALILILLLAACVRLPDGIQPVNEFELDRYLGKWYEVARLDHSFERGLSNISAEYSRNEDGTVNVVNRGFDVVKGEWREADGTAKFVDESNVGYLKVSFFGPFYGAYVVFELDKASYQYALVSGPNRSYFWLLARTPTIDSDLQQRLIAKAASLGFATDELIFVDHGEPAASITASTSEEAAKSP